MLNRMKSFVKSESGAVTVDWVVLTAAIVLLGFLVMQLIKPSITGLAQKISTSVDAMEVDKAE